MAVALAACSSDGTTPMNDMTASVHDMASSTDMAPAMCVDAGPKAFGQPCTTDCECVTGMCRQFQMGAVHLCTKPCTPQTAAQDCPMPPSTGQCTNNNYCKF